MVMGLRVRSLFCTFDIRWIL